MHSALGQLQVQVQGHPWRVQVRLQRAEVSRLLLGQTAQQAIHLIASVHSICRLAQSAAARRAFIAAGLPSPVLASALSPVQERIAIAAEVLQEHLWRCLKDWPTLCATGIAAQNRSGTDREGALFVPSYRQVQQLQQSLPLATDRLAMQAWQALQRALRQTLEAKAIVWSDLQQQTVAQWLSPACGRAHLQAKLRARWQALWQLLAPAGEQQLWADLQGTAVPTARGPLHHTVTLDTAQRIAAYRIVAPTDVHFAPGGGFEQAVQAWPALNTGLHAEHSAQPTERDSRMWALRAWLLAFDPCVPYQLHWYSEEDKHA